jgi:hypothetical protein
VRERGREGERGREINVCSWWDIIITRTTRQLQFVDMRSLFFNLVRNFPPTGANSTRRPGMLVNDFLSYKNED